MASQSPCTVSHTNMETEETLHSPDRMEIDAEDPLSPISQSDDGAADLCREGRGRSRVRESVRGRGRGRSGGRSGRGMGEEEGV